MTKLKDVRPRRFVPGDVTLSILIEAMPPKKKSAGPMVSELEAGPMVSELDDVDNDVDMAEAPDSARELELEKMFDLDDDWSLPGAGAVTKKRQQGRAKSLSVAQAVGFVL